MSNTITATITATTIVVAERNGSGLVCKTVLEEARPASFELADQALAFASVKRTAAWELGEFGHVTAPVEDITRENVFNGTVAARLEQAIGTTHDEIELASARTIENGDIITDADHSVLYVVAGSSWESGSMKVHMVAEGRTWADRYTSEFPGLVHLARRKA
jgi:hypothetical protein